MSLLIPVAKDIESHVALIHELAAPYAGKGVLIVASYGEDCATGDKIPSLVKHFDIGDVQSMVAWIKDRTALQHRNVYIPLAVFKPDLKANRKGGETDILAVLGFVGDFDDADAANYARRLPLPPDCVLETSEERYQTFYLFGQPISVEDRAVFDRVKAVVEQLKAFAKCDHGTADLSHVWRIPGTLNHPNKKKVDGGRSPVPQIVKVSKPCEGTRTDFTQLQQSLASVKSAPSPPPANIARGGNGALNDVVTFLPPDLQRRINSKPAPEEDRSKTVFSVIAWLIRLDFDDEKIEEIIRAHPEGIGEKYVDRKDLDKEIARVRIKVGEQAPEGASPDQDAHVQQMNTQYAVVPVGNKVAIMFEAVDPTSGETFLQFFKFADVKVQYANRFVSTFDAKGKPKQICIADHWLRHPQRRGYEGLVFDPTENAPEGYYNLFRGFPVKPAKGGSCKLYLTHIRDNICRGDEGLFRYVIRWMADAVQNPAKRPGVALVLRGEEGVGKGVFASNFGSLFGSHFLSVYNGRHLTGHFNAHMEGKLLIFADEAFWAGNKDAEGVLKGLITEDWFMVERKGFDAIRIKNLVRLIIASNNDWVVPAGMEARRFLVLDVGNAHRCDAAYFRAITDEMDKGGREALMDLLQSVPLVDVNLRDVPRTQALFENQLHSFGLVEKWWYEVLVRGAINHQQGWLSTISCEELYGQFIRDQALEHKPHRPSESEFGTKLKKLTQNKVEKKRRRDGAKERSNYYLLPTLAACRASFSEVVKYEIQWEDE